MVYYDFKDQFGTTSWVIFCLHTTAYVPLVKETFALVGEMNNVATSHLPFYLLQLY